MLIRILTGIAVLWLMVWGVAVMISGVWPAASRWYLRTSGSILRFILEAPIRITVVLLEGLTALLRRLLSR